MRGRGIHGAAVAWGVALGLLAAAPGPAAARAPTLDGTWTGTLLLSQAPQATPTTATLTQTGRIVSGSLTMTADAMSGTVTVGGSVGQGKARLAGVLGPQRLRWKAHWSHRQQAWRGPLVMSGDGHTTHARLRLVRPDGGPRVRCGADYFASDAMPGVFDPICAQCHVPGGLAQGTRLRVTVGDPAATAASAIGLVDLADPSGSLLLRKPRGEVAHGGGVRFAPASTEDRILTHWIELVTAPGCDGGGSGNLYTDNCASCHGADARGTQGRPDIHCNRSIHDIVRNGRTGATETMPAFPTMTDADIATIQAFLVGLCPPGTATGAELYAGNCATCHGVDAGGRETAPGIRCATRLADAVQRGRGADMPSFPGLGGADLTSLSGFLGQLCTLHGRSGAELFAGNCSSCHGATAGGGRSGLGVQGPDIRCTGAGDYREKVAAGDGRMPAFPALDTNDVTAIVTFVQGTYCPGG